MAKTSNKIRRDGGSPFEQIQMENDPNPQTLNEAHREMLEWLKTVKFKKTILGGVSERDLWKKIGELNELYEASLLAERARYDALLNTIVESENAELKKYKRAVRNLMAKNKELEKACQKASPSGEGI
ncbi:MAG: hypothetical protein Q4B26_10905 [Eubacteriales bacterium]|nr:hypothetical protein [Eubacteriales bacterium]